MWEAATKDAEKVGVPVDKYVKQVKTNVETFVNSHMIYDREELVRYLDEAVKVKGSFTLLLGGKNVGKSTVLKSLAKDTNKPSEFLVLYIDARLSPGRLDVGLANGIAQLAAQQFPSVPDTKDWVEVMRSAIQFAGVTAVDRVASEFGIDRKEFGEKKRSKRYPFSHLWYSTFSLWTEC